MCLSPGQFALRSPDSKSSQPKRSPRRELGGWSGGDRPAVRGARMSRLRGDPYAQGGFVSTSAFARLNRLAQRQQWAQSRRRWRVSSTSARHRACVKTMWPATVSQYPIGPRSSAERKIRGFTRERNKIVHCRYGTTFLHSLHPLQTFNLQHCNTTPHLAATHRQRPAARPGAIRPTA